MAQTAQPGTQQQIKPVGFSSIQCSSPVVSLCPSDLDGTSSLQVATPDANPLSAGQLWGFLEVWPESSIRTPGSSLYRIFNARSGLCIDADGNVPNPSSDTAVQQFPWQPGQQNQVWLYDAEFLLSGYTTTLWCQAGSGEPPQTVALQPYQQNQNYPSTYAWTISGLATPQLYYIESAASGGGCLTADPGGDESQLTLTPIHDNGLPTQMWAFVEYQGNYRIFNVYNGLCADAAGNGNPPSPGTNVIEYGWRQQVDDSNWQPQPNQVWTLTALGNPPSPSMTLWTLASGYDSTMVWSNQSGSVQLEQAQLPVPSAQEWRFVEILPVG
jgi:Ricin-type beta-trefoil lectin domain-like